MQWDEMKVLTRGQLIGLLNEHEKGEHRADFRNAQVCWILAEVNRDKEKRSEPYTPFDFLPGWEKRPLTEAEAIAKFNQLWKPPTPKKNAGKSDKRKR